MFFMATITIIKLLERNDIIVFFAGILVAAYPKLGSFSVIFYMPNMMNHVRQKEVVALDFISHHVLGENELGSRGRVRKRFFPRGRGEEVILFADREFMRGGRGRGEGGGRRIIMIFFF